MEEKNIIKNILGTEARNQKSTKLDMMSVYEILSLMNKENSVAVSAVESAIPQIEEVVKVATNVISSGGRIIYIGAGTSGRLGVLDSSECPPTFGVSEDVFVGVIAGGDKALRLAIEGAEDDKNAGRNDLININLKKEDMLIGIAASGSTPYVIGAMEYAKSLGCQVVAIVNNQDSSMGKIATSKIELLTGAEVLSGSTRLKAGTAQKLVLNMISTSVMIGLGKVYENLMVDVKPTNEKLRNRAISIVMQATDVEKDVAKKALIDADGNIKIAIFMLLTGKDKNIAEKMIKEEKGFLRKAIEIANKENG